MRLAGLMVLATFAAGCSAATPPPTINAAAPPSSTTTAADPHEPTTSTIAPPTATTAPAGDARTVERVVDGDTIVVRDGEKVRLIGVDTPETRDPRTGVQCFGREASAYTSSLLPAGTAVRLVFDVERLDRYGRTLAYVHRADGLFVNAALVEEGYAYASTYPPNVTHSDEFRRLAADARDRGRGLWSACGGDSRAAPAPAPPPGGRSNCDAAYPTTCIPSPPPDLDCGDVSERRFEVRPPDPHRFDADGDGVGCERG